MTKKNIEWIDKIPTLRFPKDWGIKIVPPGVGVLVRFLVVKGNTSVSVFLAHNDHFGEFDTAHWEIFPYREGACLIPIDQPDELIKK